MREKLLDAAEKLVQDRGLNAVSFQDLADAVGLRKPSVFHHFPNKEVLARALIERCQTKHGPAYAAVVESDSTAPEKLRQLAQIFEKGLREHRPCLIAALGAGINTLPEVAAEELSETAMADAATGYFAMLQGLQVLVRAGGNPDAFHAAANTYIESVSAHRQPV